MSDDLSRLWRGYSEKVYGPDYPLYRALARAVSQDEEILEWLGSCPPEAHDPNMLLAALQFDVLGGSEDPLATLYSAPDNPPDPDEVARILSSYCSTHRAELTEQLSRRHIQTNETGRCGGIALGLAAAAERIGEPLSLIDDGASAGLNLALDEYLIDFGGRGTIGPPSSPVRLPCTLTGDVPAGLVRMPALGRRIGIDRSPVDLHDPDTVRWMIACIWPGTGRQERARAAIELQAGRPGLVRAGDMVEDLGPALEDMGGEPVAVLTSWSYSYLSLEARARFQAVLATAGRRRPVAWICCDGLGVAELFQPDAPPPEGPIPSVLGLAVYRGDTGPEASSLAYMHSHGQWIQWLGPGTQPGVMIRP